MSRYKLKAIVNFKNILICVCILLGMIIFFLIEKKNEPIIIGFSAQLTGNQAQLGVQERNGVQLAIEEINAAGGIKGREVSLIIHDDLGMAVEAEEGDRELINEGAIAIIGHATTSQTLAGLKAANAANIVMISPTVSTPELNGIDDYFFRVYPSFKNSAESFAEYVYKNNKITRMAIIYDNDNKTYSEAYSKVFADKYNSVGGHIIDEAKYSSMGKPDFPKMISRINESNPEGLLIIGSDIDTALIAQRVRIMGWKIPLFATAWAQTETLISNGGHAVEGMKVEQSCDLNNKSKTFESFVSNYKDRFASEPSFGAAYSYEATLVLAEALKKTSGKKDGLKQALLEVNNFRGVLGAFSFDKYGDVNRPWYIGTIKDRKFIMVDGVAPINSGGE